MGKVVNSSNNLKNCSADAVWEKNAKIETNQNKAGKYARGEKKSVKDACGF